MSGSAFRLRRTPKLALLVGPISISCAISSPFRSSQLRGSLAIDTGLYVEAKPGPCDCTYFPIVPLIAVLPLPNRSYDAPNLGETSFQFGTLGTRANRRSGTNRPAGEICSGTSELK